VFDIPFILLLLFFFLFSSFLAVFVCLCGFVLALPDVAEPYYYSS